MKNIPNIPLTIELKPGEVATAATLLNLCLANPPPAGFDYAMMRARNRVSDAIDGLRVGDEIKLEDADYATAVEAVKTMRWAAKHKDILKFAELFGV